jgi:hypothetical protein
MHLVGLSRKRRASQMKDILEELDDRQYQLENSQEEYEKLALSQVVDASAMISDDTAPNKVYL